ncbi:MAG: AMP-binding protein, partial [Xanthomonadales bacterium]|nr:AMP-binding protein [Xanthomonadales bacterium]
MDREAFERATREAREDADAFWAGIARRVDWIQPFTEVSDVSWDAADLHIRWFADGTLNACYNCVDRHLDERGDQVAILWEGDDPETDARISYRELHGRVCRMANVIKSLGIERGDRVTLYLPMIPEAAVAMLACARIGAVHSVVFGGFSPDALAGRIVDCGSKLVITADEGRRGGKRVPLKRNVDEACR